MSLTKQMQRAISKMEEVKLLGSKTSQYCVRVEWALKLKGVKYEYQEEDLVNKSAQLLNYNPVHKKVPVLVHCGKAIAESLIILEYIDEIWKDVSPLLPSDPYDRAMARFWAQFADDKCVYGAWWAIYREGEEKKKAIEEALESFTYMEKQIQGKKFFGGEQIGYLDLALGWIPPWLGAMEEVGGVKLITEEKFPYLHSWVKNFNEVPEVKECIPSRETLVKYFEDAISYVRAMEAQGQSI